MTHPAEKIIVGSEEWCAFPELGISAIKARVDSGAKTSSLHAFNIHTFKKDAEAWISFEIHPLQQQRYPVIRCEAKIIDRRRVKSSTGIAEKRYVIKTTLNCGGEYRDVELTLSNRDSMGYRMLLGREAMKGRMLVDPAASFCLGRVSEQELQQLYQLEKDELKKGLVIGLLASNPDLYSNQRIIEAAQQRGHQIEFLNINQCYMKLDAEAPEVYSRGGRVLTEFDAVITRIRPSLTYYGCALTRQFESMGVYCSNSSKAITQSRDKLLSLQLMLNANIGIPTTGFASSPIDTSDLIEMLDGAPMVVKYIENSRAHRSILAETKEASESTINTFKSIKANMLVQEFIKEANTKDVRCFVIDNKVVASIERTAAAGEFRAKLKQGASANRIKITPEERKMAIAAAKLLSLKVAGVDIIRSKKGSLVLEVHSSPGLEGVETACGSDIAGMMIAAVEKKLGWKRELNQAE